MEIKLSTQKYRSKFKKSYIFYFVGITYIIMCQSCVTMRSSEKTTKAFFQNAKLNFIDSNFVFENKNIHFIKTGDQDKPTLFFIHGSPGS